MIARDWLEDAEGFARRLSAASAMSRDPDIYGGHCTNCCERWSLPADEASCPHLPICEDCWPNGCAKCEARVEADLHRRELIVHNVTQAAESLEQTVLDLTDSDLDALDWLTRSLLLRNVDRATEALRNIGDRTQAKTGPAA